MDMRKHVKAERGGITTDEAAGAAIAGDGEHDRG
jgi:hypothetical protein